MKILVISDVHLPYSNKKAIELLFKFIPLYKPDRIIIAGDLIDMYSASRFLTNPDYGVSIVEEIEQGIQFLKRLRVCAKNARIDFIEGNHDFRLRKYILDNANQIAGIEGIKLENLLKLKELDIGWKPVQRFATSFVDNWLTVEGVHIGHFNKAAAGSGMTVRSLMQRGGSYVQGHTHRAGLILKRNLDGTQSFGVENPCLYDFGQAPYTSSPDWMMGWTTITDGQPELILINNVSFTWGGKIYR